MKRILAGAAALMLSATMAGATILDDADDFAALAVFNTETFNVNGTANSPSATFPDFTVSDTGANAGVNTTFNPIPSSDNTTNLATFLNVAGDTLRFDSFTAGPLGAFGLEIFSGGSGTVDVTVNDAAVPITSFAIAANSPIFFGLIDMSGDGINSIAFSGSGLTGVFSGVDNVLTGIAAAVPLPAGGVLLLTGLGALILRRRIRG